MQQRKQNKRHRNHVANEGLNGMGSEDNVNWIHELLRYIPQTGAKIKYLVRGVRECSAILNYAITCILYSTICMTIDDHLATDRKNESKVHVASWETSELASPFFVSWEFSETEQIY